MDPPKPGIRIVDFSNGAGFARAKLEIRNSTKEDICLDVYNGAGLRSTVPVEVALFRLSDDQYIKADREILKNQTIQSSGTREIGEVFTLKPGGYVINEIIVTWGGDSRLPRNTLSMGGILKVHHMRLKTLSILA